MYGKNNEMYLSPQSQGKRKKWSKAQIDARRKKLLGDDPKSKYKIKDWHVISIRQGSGFVIQFDIAGNVNEARFEINQIIKELKEKKNE